MPIRSAVLCALAAATLVSGCGGSDPADAPGPRPSSGPSVLRVTPAPDGEGHTHAPGEDHATPVGDGTTPAAGGYRLVDVRLDAGGDRPGEVAFRVVDRRGRTVTEFVEEQTKLLHLYVVRNDLSDFRHLHPTLGDDGTWRTRVDLAGGGRYRVLAEFTPGGSERPVALGVARRVPGPADGAAPEAAAAGTGDDGVLEVGVVGSGDVGPEGRLQMDVRTIDGGDAVRLGSYLGTSAHLTGFRYDDGGFVHVHPYGEPETGEEGTRLTFHTTFEEPGDYRFFLQVRVDGFLHTLPVTAAVG